MHTALSLLFLAHIYPIFGIKIDELPFAGIGSVAHKTPTSVYTLSNYFKDDMCSSKDDTNCWNPQGISSYGEYITHSFYQAGDCGRDCTGSTNKDGSIRYFSAISVQKMSDAKYEAILVNTFPYECHAGDHVLTKINDIYYFIIACEQSGSDYLAIFSENDIEYFKDGVRESYKTFKYIVYDIIKIYKPEGMNWDFISRYHGEANHYIVGNYDKDYSKASVLNMKKIEIDPDNDWKITIKTEYGVASKYAKKVQGATMVKGKDGVKYMMLSTNDIIRRCDISSNNVLGPCYKQCSLPTCNDGDSLALQGGETDDSGSYFVATEWSKCLGFAFYKIQNMLQLTDQDEHCLNYADNRLNAPQAQAVINNPDEMITSPSSHNSIYLISPWFIAVVTVLVVILSINTYCIYKKNKNIDPIKINNI